MQHTADILLVTATEVETLAVLELAERPWSRRPIAGVVYYDLGVLGGAAVWLVQSAMGSVGLGASAQTVQEGIAALRPVAVVMVGIAFGMATRSQRIGDVLVASQILLYEPQRVGVGTDQPAIQPRGTRADVSPWLLSAFRSGCLDWRPEPAQTSRAVRSPRVHIGLVLSGEKLIDNTAVREQLRLIEPESIGGEMEGAGLYAAAQQRKVDWILVKAICDWADGRKAFDKRRRQRQAALHAAQFVFHVIRQGALARAAAPLPAGAPAFPARPQALYQLRAPAGDFIGRAAAAERLAQALRRATESQGVAALASIQGMGGVGKTELAYLVADRVAPCFPDGQIVVALHGSAAAPLAPAQALQTVLRAFAPETPLPEDLPALEACYRAQLHGKRVLILADDARDAAQVRPLTPPPGCALLTTSRMRFTLPAMAAEHLEQLAPAEATALLLRICPRLMRDEAALLAQACGCLPLALRVSAGMLHTMPAIATPHYLAALADTRRRLEHLRDPDDPQLDVAAALALSYAQLDAPAQQVFCQLGVIEADFTTELARAVVELPGGADVEPALHHLLRRNLIMYDPARARWRLHDLVRDLALHRLERSGAAGETGWRYGRVALRLAQQAGRGFRAGGGETLAALALFDAERFHIDAAYRWGRAHTGRPAGDELLLGVALATAQIGELRLDAQRQRLPQLKQALDAARRLGERGAVGQLLLYLGRTTFDLGAVGQAVPIWEAALAVFRELQDSQSESLVLGNLGTAAVRLGDPQRAIIAFEHALTHFRELGDRRREAHVLGNLGAACVETGDVRAAVSHLGRALAYARAAGDQRFEGILLTTISGVLRALGLFRRALSVCGAGLAIARKIGDQQQEGYALINQGRAAAHLDEPARAAVAFDQALVRLHEVGDRWGVAECRWHYGLVLAHQGERARALPLLQASVGYRVGIGHRQAAAHAALLARLEGGEALPTSPHRRIA
ncbi:MAG TPA: tetratricopeptide repeat protein [Roseiflexaceae bacterium]|nr:tetratricopeptide repeat protein [Roseiflexaceae bacterium]